LNAIHPENRSKKIREAVRKNSRDTDKIAEILNLFYKEGLNDILGNKIQRTATCECVHKRELDNLNAFIDFFQAPVTES
jgi:hypothetical protein